MNVRNIIPESILNNTLLIFPFLYKTKFVHYESHLATDNKIERFLEEFDNVNDIEGDIIECGSARCGTSLILANHIRKKGIDKKIYACDSFQGFDKKEHNEERKLDLTTSSSLSFTTISYEYVTKKINKLGFSDIVIPVKGYFEETLPKIQSKFCFALIDCDLEKSLIFSAEHVWKHLSKNGVMLFDDYTSEMYGGAKIGIDFFVNKFKNEIRYHGLKNGLYIIKKG